MSTTEPVLLASLISSGSAIVLAIISRGGPIFKSKWCLMELEAAVDAKIPIVPIYNGDVSSLQDVKDLIDGKVEGLGKETAVYEHVISKDLGVDP